MSVKLQKIPKSACYLTGGDDTGALKFALLAEGEDEDDEEEDDEDMADDEGEEDDESSESDDEQAAEGDGEEEGESDDDEDEPEPEPAKAKRAFAMLAHTGKLISRWWGNLVLDMDGAHFRQKLPLLKDHYTSQPLGFSTSIKRTAKGIEARGKMLSNEDAAQVIAYSREGYPWQASLMAVPTKVENVEAGVTAMVNGREVLGPVSIFREWTMHELTITTLGADDDTETQAFAAEGEIQVQIMTKTKNDTRAATGSPSPSAAPPTGVQTLSGAEQERERVSRILASADPAQQELARELVSDGTALADALERLNQDMRQRLSAAGEGLRVHAQPLSGGNTSGRDGSGQASTVTLEAMPDDPELLAHEWDKNPTLRNEFQSKQAFLAWGQNRHRCVHAGNGDQGMAQLLGGGLKGLGHRNVQGNYFMRYQETQASLWYPRIVTSFTTDQDHEIFKWLGNVANPRKFAGERQLTSLTDYEITLFGEKFELTVGADIDDLRRDKTGQMLRRIGEMGRKMASMPERLVTTLLTENPTAYDGLPFFSTVHEAGKSGQQSNDITVTGVTNPDKPTSEQMSDVILEGIKQLYSLLDDQGDPINDGARKFLIVVPVKYMNVVPAALKNEFTSAGVSNTIKSTDFQIDFAVNPRFSSAASAAGRRIHIFREDAELRSILWQSENIPDAFKSQDAMSGNGFWQDKVAWGAKDIVTAAPGRYELAARVNISA